MGHALLHTGYNSFFLKQSTDFVTARYEREADLFAFSTATIVPTSIASTTCAMSLSESGIPLNIRPCWESRWARKKDLQITQYVII